MTRYRTVLVTLAVVVGLAATPVSTGLNPNTGTDASIQTQVNETNQTDDGPDEPEGDPDEERNLTGDNETSIVTGNESARREAGLANVTDEPATEPEGNQTFQARQEFNGTFQIGNATGVYDHAVMTGRNGSINIFVRNMTIATNNETTTLLNTFIAIGNNQSRQDLSQLSTVLAGELNDTAPPPAEGTIEPVGLTETEPDERAAGEDTPGETPQVPPPGTQSNPELRELGLTDPAAELSESLPAQVLDTYTRVKVDVANVRQNDTVHTYRNVVYRGTLREVLTGQAATGVVQTNETGDANVTFEREYFRVTNLDVPATVTLGESYQVNATVVNRGDDDGAEEVAYKIAGEQQGEQLVRLDGNESTTVSFEVTVSQGDIEPGTHEHGVYAFAHSETGVVSVNQPNASTAEPNGPQNETTP